jgi:hypothetical protein
MVVSFLMIVGVNPSDADSVDELILATGARTEGTAPMDRAIGLELNTTRIVLTPLPLRPESRTSTDKTAGLLIFGGGSGVSVHPEMRNFGRDQGMRKILPQVYG